MTDLRRGSLVPPPGWLATDLERETSPGAGYLLLVTALALLLRLFHLAGQSLWIDESFTWSMVEPGQGLRFFQQMFDAYQGPLYHAAVWPLVRWEPTLLMLRLPAALAATATVPLLGLAAGRLWGRYAGRLAALLLALSPFHVWYAQEARGYAFLMLFTVASGLLLLRMLRARPGWGAAAGLALLTAGGLLSNMAFVFLLLAYGLTVLLTARPRTGRDWAVWSVALGGGVLLTVPWLLRATGIWAVERMLPGAATGEALRGATTFTWWALPYTGYSFLYGFSLGPSLRELHGAERVAAVAASGPEIAVATLVAAIALVAGLWHLRGRGRVLLLWILVPLVCVVALALRNVKPYNVRYVAVAFPWVLAIVALGAASLRRPWRIGVGLALCLVFGLSLVGYYFDARYAKADVRGAVAALAEQDRDTLPILAPNVGRVVRFYYEGAGEVLGCGDEPVIRDRAGARALVARQLGGHDQAWVVWAHTWFLDPRGLLPDALADAGRLVRAYEGPGVAVDLWRRQRGAAAGDTAAVAEPDTAAAAKAEDAR